MESSVRPVECRPGRCPRIENPPVSTTFRTPLGLLLTVTFLAACSPPSGSAASGSSADPQVGPPTAANIAAHYPQPTDELIRQITILARRSWRGDANVTEVEYTWYPKDATPKYYWAVVTVSSPRDGARRFYDVGDYYGGTVIDAPPDDTPLARAVAVRDAFSGTRIDLRQALAAVWALGFHTSIDSMQLEMVGARGTRSLLAWRVIAPHGPGFPITVSAETGGILSWRRAYDAPYWTDEKIRAVMQQLLNRSRPPVIPDNDMGCIPGVGMSTGGCSPD